MNYRFNWDNGDVFAVPDSVAGDCLKLASGKWVKVLIYMLKYRKLPDDPSDIGVLTEDVEEALAYWQEHGIIIKCDAACCDAACCDTDCEKKAAPKQSEPVKILAAPPEPVMPKAAAESIKPRKSLLPEEIVIRINESEEIRFLFQSAEMSLKRVLTFDDQRTILWFYDHLGMSADIIIMLIAYCCSIDKSNMAYIEKIAIGWHDKNITTHEQAENEILFMQKAFSYEGKVRSRLKLENKLSKAQKNYIDQWALWDISIELVELAHDKTLNNKGKTDFNYMNGIIRKWHENGITDVTAAESYDDRTMPKTAARKSQPQANTSAPSFDLSLILEHAKNNKPTL